MIHSIRSIFRSRIEYFLLLISLIALLVVYYMKNFSVLFLIIFILLGLILYIILKGRHHENENEDNTFQQSHAQSSALCRVTSIVFFACFTLSILTLLDGFYSKSIWYYFFMAICTATVASEILLIRTERQGMFNLTKSFLIALNITLSNQIIFPLGISLPDFGLHFNKFVLTILETGFLPTGTYANFPVHHILSAMTILSSGFEAKMTYLCLGGFLVSLGVLFIYLIGKKFVNMKFGLFAAVLFICLDYYIMYGAHPEHQAYNYAYSIILFALILYFYKSEDRRVLLSCMFMMAAMVFTHHFSAMIVLILVGSMVLVEVFQRHVNHGQRIRLWPVYYIFGLILFVQWIYYSELFGRFLGMIDAYVYAFQDVSGNVVGQIAYDNIPLSTLFANTLGSSILLLLSAIGFVVYFKRRSLFDRFVMVAAVVLSLLLVVGMVFKQVALLPDRLYPFLQIFALVFLAASGLYFILAAIKSQPKKIVTVFSIIMVLSFFSLSSTIAGFETSPFVDESISYPKLYTTQQEMNFNRWYTEYAIDERNLLELPLTKEGTIPIKDIPAGSILPYDSLYLRTGFIQHYGGHMGQYDFVRMAPGESEKLNSFENIYDNGIMNAYAT